MSCEFVWICSSHLYAAAATASNPTNAKILHHFYSAVRCKDIIVDFKDLTLQRASWYAYDMTGLHLIRGSMLLGGSTLKEIHSSQTARLPADHVLRSKMCIRFRFLADLLAHRLSARYGAAAVCYARLNLGLSLIAILTSFLRPKGPCSCEISRVLSTIRLNVASPGVATHWTGLRSAFAWLLNGACSCDGAVIDTEKNTNDCGSSLGYTGMCR